jgi:hypothetical protein
MRETTRSATIHRYVDTFGTISPNSFAMSAHLGVSRAQQRNHLSQEIAKDTKTNLGFRARRRLGGSQG